MKLLLAVLGTTALAFSALARTVSGQVVGQDGKPIANAVVFVQEPASLQPAASSAPAIMDQFNKTFVPEMLPIAVGTQVRFPNRDQIRHHVYSFSRPKRFELPLYKGEDAPPVLFDKPGVVKIGCNIHDWMSAIILVLPNDRFAVTKDDGTFSLPGLDSGQYTITAWHAQSRDKT
ncbi:MAG TPA: methylamine utilization protein, partial [Steroidobacteraceae bacterium]|nr:methylamine utilization protein [Steroidobacteraceae bacterium]